MFNKSRITLLAISSICLLIINGSPSRLLAHDNNVDVDNVPTLNEPNGPNP